LSALWRQFCVNASTSFLASSWSVHVWAALDDLDLERTYVVAPVRERYPLAKDVDVVPVQMLKQLLA
jgi:hypothetical protein